MFARRRDVRARRIASLTALLVVALAPAASAAPQGQSRADAAAPQPQFEVVPRAASAPIPWALVGPPPLATPAANTSSGFAPLGDVSKRYAFSEQTSDLRAADRPARAAALLGALGVGATGDTPLRAGGSGVLTVSLSRQTDVRSVVRDTRVTIAIPAAYRLGKVAAPGWRCGPGGSAGARSLRCAARGAVAAGDHSAVRVGLIARRAGRARVRVAASWRQGSDRMQLRRGAAAETFVVRAPLAVRVRSSEAKVLGGARGVDSAPIVLSARLRRYDAGLPVDYRWRQLCGRGDGADRVGRGDRVGAQDRADRGGSARGTRVGAADRADRAAGCPSVRWQTPRSGRASGALVTAQVSAPAVSRATRLRFALTARDWRGEARGVTTVTVLPQTAARFAPGTSHLRVRAHHEDDVRTYVSRERMTRGVEIGGSGLAGPRAGRRVTLLAMAQGGELDAARWSLQGGPRGFLRQVSTDEPTLSFVIPSGVRQLTFTVRAVVSGHVVRDRATVHVAGYRLRSRARSRRTARAFAAAAQSARARGGAFAAAAQSAGARDGTFAAAAQSADADEDPSPFCSLWSATAGGDATGGTDAAPIALPDGTAIALGGAVALGTGCDDDGARVDFTAATVRVGSVVYEDVTGTLDAGGIAFRSGWLDLPTGWFDDMPARLHLAPAIDGGFGAALQDDGRWAPLHAQIALDEGVELLPLPEGWGFPQGQSWLRYTAETKTFALHSVAQAPAGQNGAVTLDGSLALDGSTAVTVTADRLISLDGVDGRQVSLSGSGTLRTTLGGDDGLTGSISPRTVPADGRIPLTQDVSVGNVVAEWDADGIDVGSDVYVETARGLFQATASGSYSSSSEWRLSIVQRAPFALADGVVLDEVQGSIERVPADDDESSDDLSGARGDWQSGARAGAAARASTGARAGTGARASASADAAPSPSSADTFAVSLAGAVSGWSPSPSLKNVTVRGAITNVCEEDDEDCSTRDVRLALDVRGDAQIAGQSLAWYGIANANLSTMAVRFEGGADLAEFGPDELRMTNVQLRLSSSGPTWCTPNPTAAGATAAQSLAATPSASAAAAAAPDPTAAAPAAPLAADQELTFGISGRGRLMGQPFEAAGEFARSGYCLTGAFGTFTPDGLSAGGGGASKPLIDEVRFAYASKAADLVVAGQPISLRAGEARLTGALNLPQEKLPEQLRDVLGGRADITLGMTRGSGGSIGLYGSALFRLARPIYVMGSAARADEARLGLTGAQLSVSYGAGTSLRLEMAARAALQTPANAAKGVGASSTPLFLAAGIDLGLPSVNVSAGVDTGDPSLSDGTVRDAFGQPGLDVRRLLVSASLGADTSIGIAADATLPNGWTRSLGMPDRTPAKVAFSVSQTSPCLELEVGRMPPLDGRAVTPEPILRLGPLSANYAQIVVAPTGCTIGNPAPGGAGYRIEPGFAFAFDGAVGPTPVTFAAALRKYDATAFALRGTVRVGAFDAGPVSFRRTALDLDIDTGGSNRRIDVAFEGGLDAGESTIDVSGRFRANDNEISAQLSGRGRLRLAGTTFAEGSIDASVEFAKSGGSWTAKSANVNARTQILGAEAGLLLSYRDGAVGTVAGAFQFYGSVGPMGMHAGALFAYAPDGVRLDGPANDCSISRLSPQQNGKELILRMCSTLFLGPLVHSMTMTVELPQRWDFDIVVPRSEVGIVVASIYLQGELRTSLQVGLSGLKFWVRSGNARAGGCIDLWLWSDCADAINVNFNPYSGRFEGTFLGYGVDWGSDSWRTSPAPPSEQPQQEVHASDRVYVGRADRAAFDSRVSAGSSWRRSAYAPVRGGAMPAGAVFDPERRQVTMLLPLTPQARGEAPRPARAYVLTFNGVAFDGSSPRTSPRIPLGGGSPQPAIDYDSVDVARIPDSGTPVTASVGRAGSLVLGDGGRRLSWNVAAGPRANDLDGFVADKPFNDVERDVAERNPELIRSGLPLAAAVRFPSADRTVESRAALQKAAG